MSYSSVVPRRGTLTGRQTSTGVRAVTRVLLWVGDVVVFVCAIGTMEKLMTRHGNNELRVWGWVVSRDADRLADLQLVFFYLVNICYVCHACSDALKQSDSDGVYKRIVSLYSIAQQPNYQEAGNRLLIVVWVMVERLFMAIGFLSGGVCICTVTAAVLTACMRSVPLMTRDGWVDNESSLPHKEERSEM